MRGGEEKTVERSVDSAINCDDCDKHGASEGEKGKPNHTERQREQCDSFESQLITHPWEAHGDGNLHEILLAF